MSKLNPWNNSFNIGEIGGHAYVEVLLRDGKRVVTSALARAIEKGALSTGAVDGWRPLDKAVEDSLVNYALKASEAIAELNEKVRETREKLSELEPIFKDAEFIFDPQERSHFIYGSLSSKPSEPTTRSYRAQLGHPQELEALLKTTAQDILTGTLKAASQALGKGSADVIPFNTTKH